MSQPPESPPVNVTLVHATACHYCDDAMSALSALAVTWPLAVRVVDLESPEGAELVREHRPAMNPLVLVDGVFFSSGRLPRKKLAALLGARSTATHVVTGAGA